MLAVKTGVVHAGGYKKVYLVLLGGTSLGSRVIIDVVVLVFFVMSECSSSVAATQLLLGTLYPAPLYSHFNV